MSNNHHWTAENIPDQSGQVAIVTGANSGIGYETAQALAHKGATVVMACRNQQKGRQAVERISNPQPAGQVELLALDLSDLASVRSFAAEFKNCYSRLDLLINNAGVMALPKRTETADGFEMQFGTNHLGHFALTGLLLDTILSTPGARIVTVSSTAHRTGKIDFANLNAEKGYGRWHAYGQSKLANLLFTYELQRRLAAASANAIAAAAHPGWTATNLQIHSGIFSLFNPFFGQKPPMGALPTLYAAAGPDVQGGDFFGPGGIGEWRGYPKKVKSNGRSHDQAVAARLWQVSEELTGVRFDSLPG